MVNSPPTAGQTCRQQSGGDVVHIGHAVLKAADDKEAHRHKGPYGPPRQTLAAQGAHHPGAHQNVAQNSQHHRPAEGNGALGGSGANDINCQCLVGKGPAEGHCRRQQSRPGKVSQVDNRQIPHHSRRAGFPLQQGDGNHAVSGKQLRPGEDDHDEPEGEQQAADNPSNGGIIQPIGGRSCRHRAGGDKESRQHCRQKQSDGAVGTLFLAHLGIKQDKFPGAQHSASTFLDPELGLSTAPAGAAPRRSYTATR